ncbi:phosphoribosylformylglycinamidine cyclo-ligase [Legionella sp.]|uniref:phosphoribosylformylglycinamidine cyclo-ligase n=1 Tax=Legionella sp. TaxID=459 RepID=UPI003CC25E46
MLDIIDYKAAGVDIQAGNKAVRRIKKVVEKTFSPQVLTEIGGFASLYDLKNLLEDYQHPVLVQSIDGVGTKAILARQMNRFDTIGIDAVSATANDIVVLGAKPLTLLDYIANDKLCPDVVEQIIEGMATACYENGISLVGGETAEMPGTYLPGEHDIVAVITGVVDKDKVILGKNIVPGDVVLGLSSSGLHTNGYSLARKLFFEIGKYTVDSWHPELNNTIGETLLKPHLNYTKPILHLLQNKIEIKGMVHVTGGGFQENIPRILPEKCAVEIKRASWDIPPVFLMMRDLGRLSEEDLFSTFNMGIGLIMIIDEDLVNVVQKTLSGFSEFSTQKIGHVVAFERQKVRMI